MAQFERRADLCSHLNPRVPQIARHNNLSRMSRNRSYTGLSSLLESSRMVGQSCCQLAYKFQFRIAQKRSSEWVPEPFAKERNFKKHCAGNDGKFRHLQIGQPTGLALQSAICISVTSRPSKAETTTHIDQYINLELQKTRRVPDRNQQS
jgi:hypothetical protein